MRFQFPPKARPLHSQQELNYRMQLVDVPQFALLLLTAA
jgi:hypothetical protein